MNNANDGIDAKLDGWLSRWPAPELDENAWEDFGSKLEERLSGTSMGHGEEAWLEPPLPAEPGEGDGDNAKLDAGGARMSEPESDKPKKKSLKDFAQRVSVVPPVASDAKPTETPITKAGETPLPNSGPRASSPSLRASASFVSRPPEARDSDSGIVDLNAVRKSATSIPDDGAQPGEAGLFDDERVAAPAPAAQKKGSLLPIIGGGAVAVLALAAAAVMVLRMPAGTPHLAEEAPAPLAASYAAAPAATEQEPSSTGLNPDGLEVATDRDESSEVASAPAKAGPSEVEDRTKPTAKTEETKTKTEDVTEPRDSKDLAGAMATAVGVTDKKEEAPKSVAAADPGSMPETPSQGAIQGAIGSVRESARACVAGMEEPSRATITFASNGSVSNVSVSGPAAGKPAASCIQTALKRARVSPFRRDSFTVGVTVRP